MPPPKQRASQTAAGTGSTAEAPRKQGANGTASRGSSAWRNRKSENTEPSGTRHEPRVASEKKHTNSSSASAHTRSSACTRPTSHDPIDSAAAAANKTPEINKHVQEADDEIRKLNQLGLGEDMSYQVYRGYLMQLPSGPDVDDSAKLDPVLLEELNARHALYRLRYSKLSQKVPEIELCYDQLKQDYPLRVLEKERFFERFQADGTLDWFFHPHYCKLAALDDYQRLVPLNYGDHEYAEWNAYHRYFHGYEIEQEYIKFCEELSKDLKWMEAYVPNTTPSLKWGRVLTRGSYQAIKIAATRFSKIPQGLAFFGFYEWLADMTYDVCWYKEFDGVFYEIWRRVTKQKKSFRDALDQVYRLNWFPLRQNRMECALGNDTYCSDFEEEFLACTACLTLEVTEHRARELIAEAVRNETKKPKFYEQYCRKKIDIARAIGLIPRD